MQNVPCCTLKWKSLSCRLKKKKKKVNNLLTYSLLIIYNCCPNNEIPGLALAVFKAQWFTKSKKNIFQNCWIRKRVYYTETAKSKSVICKEPLNTWCFLKNRKNFPLVLWKPTDQFSCSSTSMVLSLNIQCEVVSYLMKNSTLLR